MSVLEITFLAAVAALLLGLTVAVIVLLRRGAPSRAEPDNQGMTLLQQQVEALREQTARALADNTSTINQRLSDIDRKMGQSNDTIGARLADANRTVANVRESLGALSQATQRVYEVGKDIASLQDILRTPKLRGIIGELFLGDLLKQVVPNHYELQYRFKTGEAVDAVVRLAERLVPIDAKFPLEDFQRLNAETDTEKRKPLRRKFLAVVRKHIDAIAQKYILPDEGTFDFALMYIPAENVYYETIIKSHPDDDNLTEYAISRKVIPVSPNSLYAYLQVIVLGLRGFEVEQRAEEILRHLGRLQQEFGRFHEEFDVLGTHLKNARSKYDDAVKRLDRFESKLSLESGLASGESEQRSPEQLPGRKQ
jgi:DNA recombination protein RmuC